MLRSETSGRNRTRNIPKFKVPRWEICGRKQTRNIIAILFTLLVAETVYIIILWHQDVIWDDEGNIIGGMEPALPKPPKVFNVDKENSGLPFDSEILSDLLGFRCKCDLGYRPEAIIILHSSPLRRHLRDAVRNTWGSPEQCQRYSVVLIFVMGRPKTRLKATELKGEMQQHGDMIVGNFTSITEYSTLRTFLALRWYHQFCPPTPFLVQAYDYAFMTLNKLGDIMNSFTEGENTIIGLRKSYINVLLDHEGNIILDAYTLGRERFPPYCSL